MLLNDEQLKQIKEWFTRKIESLERDSYRAFTNKIDVSHSLGAGSAPFPIVLFCMCTLDFFSAAYFGYSEKKRDPRRVNQTIRMTEFLSKYLKYDENVSKIALDIFRHKLVHLAEPHVPSGRIDRVVGWEIASIQADGDNWTIQTYDQAGNKIVKFGVENFIKDLKNGVLGTNGYFQDLIANEQLQNNYLSFHHEIS